MNLYSCTNLRVNFTGNNLHVNFTGNLYTDLEKKQGVYGILRDSKNGCTMLSCYAWQIKDSKPIVIVKSEGLQLEVQERECEQSETECENNQLLLCQGSNSVQHNFISYKYCIYENSNTSYERGTSQFFFIFTV